MAEIKNLIEKMEDELHMIAVPPNEASGEIAQQFGTMCVIKNVLEKMSLTDEQLDMLLYMPKLLHSIEALWSDLSRDNQTIAEAVNDYLLSSVPEYRHRKLSDRARTEYEEYIESLKTMPPEKIIDAAYEIAYKADMLAVIEEITDEDNICVLLTLEQPLASLYSEWLGNDYSIMEDLELTSDDLIRKQEKDLRSQYEYGGKLPDYIVEWFESETQADPDDEFLEDLEP